MLPSGVTLICSLFNREIEYLKKETQRCAQVGAEASILKEESGQLQEQVKEVDLNEVTPTVLKCGQQLHL